MERAKTRERVSERLAAGLPPPIQTPSGARLSGAKSGLGRGESIAEVSAEGSCSAAAAAGSSTDPLPLESRSAPPTCSGAPESAGERWRELSAWQRGERSLGNSGAEAGDENDESFRSPEDGTARGNLHGTVYRELRAEILRELRAEMGETSGGGTSGEEEFEMLVAQLEAVMMDPAFNERVGDFMRAHCAEFDEGEENKLCYMQLFEQYTTMLETYIEAELGALAGPDFDMRAFCATLGSRTDAVASLDLDTLGAFGDFEAFKGMMLACKRGEMLRDEAGGAPFQIVGATMEVHADEQEDGVEMPDLNLSISSAPTLS